MMKFLWTTIYVRNMDESIAFYSNLLGLQPLRRFPAAPGIEIAFMGNGTENEIFVEFLQDDHMQDVAFGEAISIGFAITSIDDMLKTVKELGLSVHSGPVQTPTSSFFTVKDPNDLNVQLFEQK